MLSALLTLTTIASVQPAATILRASPDQVRGLWLKESSDPREFRFYYFHTGGIGLYRYGRRHLNNTNSFDFTVKGSLFSPEVVLRFRKSGEEVEVRCRMEYEDDRTVLVLENDPREPVPTRYRKVEGPLEMSGLVSGDHPFARMWTEQKKFATGGTAFRIYQFQPPDAQGRGRGWYHQGDFDDWSTEAFTYEKDHHRIHFFFEEKKEHEVTDFIEVSGQKRAIELMSDPRNFWHRARFEDGGRSIISLGGTALFGPLVR